METLFALILTSCVISENNTIVCEEFQVELATTKSVCDLKLQQETTKLFELESLRCEKVEYKVEK
ncbi:hypothetical protein ZPAH1_orf00127 [Aeromonas phage ZPAH1]|nr:hypothetical protein ASwh1_78 [Aeromonas phage Aswh_1]QQG33889.1 hypothetical protein ZPAH1_orf00127 [Aeromonas phage ZPAH1]